MAASFQLHEIARVLNGRITQTHHNACRAISEQPGPCNCAVLDFRVVRSRPARQGRRGR
jgi:hypothetical protein